MKTSLNPRFYTLEPLSKLTTAEETAKQCRESFEMFGKSMRLGAALLQPSLEMALWLLGLFRKLRFDRASQGFNQVLCQEIATVERT